MRDIIESTIKYLPPIHKEGVFFIVLFLILAFLSCFLSKTLGWIFLLLTLFCCAFFRDPERFAPIETGLIVSPADGIFSAIESTHPPEEFGDLQNETMNKVSIFLSVSDVHVNRIPIEGVVKQLHYHPGKFLNASLDKSSKFNERQSVLIEVAGKKPTKIIVAQIAGFIARRIVCNLDEGAHVKTGERFGIIRFGSRVDVYVPKNISIQVSKGQRMIGGETIIASLGSESQKIIKREKR